jgi:hypothetical protein
MANVIGPWSNGDPDSTIAYTNWEADFMTGCVCDWGYYGADCSQAVCPRGDNPGSAGQRSKTIQVTITGTFLMSGSVGLWFNGHRTTVGLSADGNSATDASCTTWVESLPNLEQARCWQTSLTPGTGSATYVIALDKFEAM